MGLQTDWGKELHVKFWSKKFGLKKIRVKNTFAQIFDSKIDSKNILGKKKTIWVKTFFESKKILIRKNVWVKKHFWVKTFLE